MTAKETTHTPGNVLIVDDEANIRKGLKAVLARDGHMVHEASNGTEALAILQSATFETAVLDIRMPGLQGTDLLHEIHGSWPHISIIMLTGHGTLETAIAAVQGGAYNYLLKPAKPQALRQIVNEAIADARRKQQETQLLTALRMGLQQLDNLPSTLPLTSPPSQSPPVLTIGGLRIDRRAFTVERDDTAVAVTPTEYKVLLILAERAGEAIDYMTLVHLGLNYEAELWEAKELIKRHIFALRKKIEPNPAAPTYILNVRGVGYRLASGS